LDLENLYCGYLKYEKFNWLWLVLICCESKVLLASWLVADADLM